MKANFKKLKIVTGVRLRGMISCAALFWLIGAASSADPLTVTVSVTDLGTLGGSTSGGFGVNNKGQVAGSSNMPDNRIVHGFFYADGKMTDLGTLGGRQSAALALNDAGQVTGHADLKMKPRYHGFLWQQGHISDLGTSRADDSDGLAINSAGQVAGKVVPGGYEWSCACCWQGGKVKKFYLPDETAGGGNAINNSGLVVGTLRGQGRHFRISDISGRWFTDKAALWDGRKMSELSERGTEISIAYAINDSGQVAGTASFGPNLLLHACVWQNGRITDLGTLAEQDTVLYAINNAGVVVGGINPNDLALENGKHFGGEDRPQHAICCSKGEITDLNYLLDTNSGWVLTDARGISDTGYVTGTGTHNGQAHAYLLKLPLGF